MTPEGKVKHKIKEILRSHDVWYFMPRGTALGTSGVPDFICCVNGRFLAIEAKAEKGKLSALQVQQLMAIRDKGKGCAITYYPGNEDLLERLIRILKCLPQDQK